jgi:hypothetical protein
MTVYHADHDHLISNHGEVQPVRKSRYQSSTFLAMNLREAEGKRGHSGQKLVEGCTKLAPKPGLAVFVPSFGIEQLPLGLRAEDDRSTHRPPLNFFRTSSQGIAVEGSASCSARRRSNSAACSEDRPNAASRSASSRLSHRAKAKSTRSLAGSFKSAAITSGAIGTSCHEFPEPAIYLAVEV